MATQIYLGNPPENIKRFIIENYGPKEDPMLKVPLHFTAEEPNATVKFGLYGQDERDFVMSNYSFQYSIDNMNSWKDYPNDINSIDATIKLDQCENQTVFFKAKFGDIIENPNLNGFGEFSEHPIYYQRFVFNGSIKAGGNIQFLLENTGKKIDAPKSCYYNMFSDCTSLTQAPLLPATTLSYGCYSSMFSGCTSLTQAPLLPATALATYCYGSMLDGCTSIAEPKYKMINLTFDEVANTIEKNRIFMEYQNMPVQVQCSSDKILVATFDWENDWIISEG